MAGERNRILEIIEYIKTLGIIVNIGKNYARGNKGVFCKRNNQFKIDLSKLLNNNERLSVILHEFAHYIHYKYDNQLKTLDFVFEDINDEIREELINVTVDFVPKDFANNIYNSKDAVTKYIKNLSKYIKTIYPDFKISEPFKPIEKNITAPLKFLLKYDKILYFNKIYSVDSIEKDFDSVPESQIAYLKIKSAQRKLKRLNSKINRINNYYNAPTELFARFIELYFTDIEKARKIAPKSVLSFEKTLSANKIKELNSIANIIKE